MSTSEKRRITLKILFWFLFINAILSATIGYQYLVHASGITGWFDHLYLHIALVSNFFLLYIGIGILLSILLFILPGTYPLFLFTIPIIFLFQVGIVVDVNIYRIFKFHFNSMILNFLMTEGAWDSVHLGTMTFVTFGVMLTVILGFEILVLRVLYNRFYRRVGKSRVHVLEWRSIKIAIAIILTIIVTDKLIHGVADLYNNYHITRHGKVLPLYYGFTMKRFMRKYFHFELNRETSLHVETADSPLNYPLAPLEKRDLEAYPNILWILIDGWRFDMFNQEMTPHIWAFSQKALVFNHHYSGGNASRFGVFSLFFGVYGYYWHQFLAARQSPVLIDALIDLGYDFRIVSSTRLTFPEFRKTAFVKIPEAIEDQLPGKTAEQKDPLLAEHFLKWLDTRANARPFFAFLFFDAPHGPYSFSDEFNKFEPSTKTTNYMMVGKKDIPVIKNSYKNAICFDDFWVGQILRYLEEHGLLKDTIVLLSSDHGEEFYEAGFLGHTNGFSKYQTNVPLILYLPGRSHQKIEYLTSHLDVVPTMLSWLGYSSSAALYSQGNNLLEHNGHAFVVSCGWNDCAIIDESTSIVFSTETYNAYLFEVRDENYRLIENYRPILDTKSPHIAKVLEGFSQFNKK